LLLAKGAMRLTGSDRLSLAGYSLGGRICLTLLELMPESVERVMLLAPDGLGGRRFYHFVTRTIIGKRLFRHYLEDGRRIARLAGLLHRCGLLGAARHRFLSKYTGSESARKLLLQVWPSMRYLVPDLRKVRNLIRKHHIPVYLFTGRHDPIIRPHFARLLSRNLPEVQVTVLDHGHYLLHEHILQKITPCLL
jgi:pimeloyl-ACP methyl ester carboxylesterase